MKKISLRATFLKRKDNRLNISIKKNTDRFLIYLGSLVFICTTLLFPKISIAQTKLLEQDKYVKKQYLTIPWGSGKGQIFLNEKNVVNTRGPEPVTLVERTGVNFIKVDEKGNLYIGCYDSKNQKSLLKKFSSEGSELAQVIIGPIDKFYFDHGNVVLVDPSIANKVAVFDEGLKLLKTVQLSKDFPAKKCRPEDGILFNINPKSTEKEKFLYDEKNAVSFESSKPKNKFKSFYKFNETNGNKILVFDNNIFKPIRYSEFIKENVWNWGEPIYDSFGNIYLKVNFGPITYRPPTLIRDVGILKLSPAGDPLCWIELDRDYFATYNSFEVPFSIDSNGNIYGGISEQNGFHIYQWKLIK